MEKIFLLASIVLLFLAVKYHLMTKTEVIKKIDQAWYDRLFTGSRPSKDNLTEQGLKFRKQSNLYAISGFASLGLFVIISSKA